MRALIESALILGFDPEDMREARADLDFAFPVEQDLAATYIIVSHSLLVHVIE